MSDADSISDSSRVHVGAGGDEALISAAIRELCNQLRANDPRLLGPGSFFAPSDFIYDCSEAEFIAFFQALEENTSVKHIEFCMLFGRHYTKRSALAAAECVEASKTLQKLDLYISRNQYSNEGRETISLFLRALSRNTSVTKLSIDADVVEFANVAFEELLTRTQTLQKLQIFGSMSQAFDEVQTAITSGFAKNTTLRDLQFHNWRETDLVSVLTALHCHPTLQKVHFSGIPRCLSGLEVLLRSHDSKVKELVLEHVDSRTVGLRLVLQELGRNTTVNNLAIRYSVLSRENIQQLKVVVRRNTALQHLDLQFSRIRNAGLAEIAPVLYRNRSIKTLDLSSNGLDDIESANMLHELLRRNKTITSLSIAHNAFGGNATAARSIFEGLRNNPALQQLDLEDCELGDRGVSVLANALAIRNASILELDLNSNQITSVGIRTLVDDNVETVKTLTKLCLTENPIRSEGATIIADALGRNAMPNLKRLNLESCSIDDDGFVALASALQQNTSLQILDLHGNEFGERGFMALAQSLENIKGLQEINCDVYASFQSTLPLLMEGFRKNTSLVEVDIDDDGDDDESCVPDDCLQELKFLGLRNRFTSLVKTSDPPYASPQLGIWSRALAMVATEPDVLFHVLRNKPKLVAAAAGSSKKRKRDDE